MKTTKKKLTLNKEAVSKLNQIANSNEVTGGTWGELTEILTTILGQTGNTCVTCDLSCVGGCGGPSVECDPGSNFCGGGGDNRSNNCDWTGPW